MKKGGKEEKGVRERTIFSPLLKTNINIFKPIAMIDIVIINTREIISLKFYS